MAIDSEFINAVKERKKRFIRIKIGNSIAIDPTLSKFNEMVEYANSNIHDLFDVHQGELRRNGWTKDYYNEQQTELSYNFSRERLTLLCDMAGHLYRDRIDAINSSRRNDSIDFVSALKGTFYRAVDAIGEGIDDFINGKH